MRRRERLADEQLHHEVRTVAVEPDVEDLDDACVRHATTAMASLKKRSTPSFSAEICGKQQLDRHLRPHEPLLGAPHLTHAALAQRLHQDEVLDHLTKHDLRDVSSPKVSCEELVEQVLTGLAADRQATGAVGARAEAALHALADRLVLVLDALGHVHAARVGAARAS